MLGLVGALPYFEAVLNTGVAHPFQVYLALCSMRAPGGFGIRGPDSFAPTTITISIRASSRIGIHRSDDGQGVPLLTKLSRLHITTVYMNFSSSTSGQKATGDRHKRSARDVDPEVNKWGENCFIGSRSKMDDLVLTRFTGTVRKRVEKAGDIVRSRGVSLFLLTNDPNYVKPDEALQIRNDEEGLRPTEIVLYVMDN